MSLNELALPSHHRGLEEATIAAAKNVLDSWTALRMIREALEAKGPGRQADGLDFLDEAETLVEAIVRLPAPSCGH